jgi:hypothetical protein
MITLVVLGRFLIAAIFVVTAVMLLSSQDAFSKFSVILNSQVLAAHRHVLVRCANVDGLL